jgi:hypothetical protein
MSPIEPEISVPCLQESLSSASIINTDLQKQKKNKLRGLSPRANYTDRTTAACRRSYCHLLRIEGCCIVSAADPLQP